ncbi:hypothetical protein GIB67_014441 [Kingdonia uniflora]|uniref:DUF668 domain-containing protein n=1 Tax=Kingdonia uniflora TaxID=39325 RepID=A0A7J7LYZ4_9MAGN|nr:hypothetical protein GIB67_014441 [Kingdonia uniflora]
MFELAVGDKPVKTSMSNRQLLGPAGLALHYANIITQIDTIVSRSAVVPSNTRDTLYQGLPPSIKSALRSKLQSSQLNNELTVPQIREEMEKTLRWLAPIATNTNKAHHGFGWVGEWANTGSDANRKPTSQPDLIRIETLHHADKEKTEIYILDLVVWLHHLVSLSRAGTGVKSPIKSPSTKSPIRSPNTQEKLSSPPKDNPQTNTRSFLLTDEDQQMLRHASKRKMRISKSQDFDSVETKASKQSILSKSYSYSTSTSKNELFLPVRKPTPSLPVIDFCRDKIKALDVIDRVDSI